MRALEDLEEDEDHRKMYNLVMDLMNDLKANNENEIKHILATDSLYSSEVLSDETDFYFIEKNENKYVLKEIKIIKKN